MGVYRELVLAGRKNPFYILKFSIECKCAHKDQRKSFGIYILFQFLECYYSILSIKVSQQTRGRHDTGVTFSGLVFDSS